MSIGRTAFLRRIQLSSVRRCAVACACAALLGGSLAVPSPGAAEPSNPHRPLTIAAAQHRIAVLDRRAEIAAERMNTVRVHLSEARRRFHGLQTEVARQRARVHELRSVVVGSAVTDYQTSAGLSVTTSFLTSRNASQFVSVLVDRTVQQNQFAGLLQELRQQQQRLSQQEQQAHRQIEAIDAARAALARRQGQLDSRTNAVEQVLARLKAQQRKRLARRQARQESQASMPVSRSAARVSTSAPAGAASGSALAAVSYALAQVGDPYVYGAAGPDAFDCSGLTMAAWAAAGVSLPHSASMQASLGTPVSSSALMPGDLVFYYSPISHVGLYIGNGQVVHAPYPGSAVEVVSVNSMPITMAVRIG